MSITDRIKPIAETSQSVGVKFMIYGASGVGKTSLVKTTPNPARTLVLSAEKGLLSVQDSEAHALEIKSLHDLREVHAFLAKGDHDYEWVILDSISEIGEVILEEELPNAAHAMQAYGKLAEHTVKILKAFRDLPLHVLFIAQQGHDVDQLGEVTYRPDYPGKKMTGKLPYIFDEVFAYRKIPKKDGEEGEVTRALLTEQTVRFLAKDRSNKLDKWEKPDLAALVNKIRA